MTLPTQNEGWGFWGTWTTNNRCLQDHTIGKRPVLTAARAWAIAMDVLVGKGGLTEEQARQVLDARIGRHLADQLWHRPAALKVELARLLDHKGWAREIRAAAEVES